MASPIDEWFVKATLDAKGYETGAQRLVHASETAVSHVSGFTNAVLGLGSVTSLISAGSLVAFGKGAVDAAIRFDTLTRSLTAVTHSAGRAQTIMSFVDQLAVPSIFTGEELGEAAKTLEAFGLQAEQYLPVAEKLGTVFGGSAEALKQYVDALGMIKGGRFGEAFESLARAGINRQDLALSYGLKFDKGGSFIGDTKQALDAVSRAVQDRFGDLSKAMQEGPQAKLASLQDQMGRAMRQIGGSILQILLPATEKVSDALGNLVQSGRIQAIADGFARLFNGNDIGDFAVKAVDRLLGFLERAPAWIEKNKDSFRSMFDAIRTTVEIMADRGGPILETIFKTVSNIVSAFNQLPKGIQNLIVTLGVTNKATGGLLGSIAQGILGLQPGGKETATIGSMLLKAVTGPIGMIGSVLILGAMDLAEKVRKGVEILERNQEMKAYIRSYQVDANGHYVHETDANGNLVYEKSPVTGKKVPKLMPASAEQKEADKRAFLREWYKNKYGFDPYEGEDTVKKMLSDQSSASGAADQAPPNPADGQVAVGYLQQIAQNTKRQVDMQRLIMGGGEAGALGVTPVELGRIHTGNKKIADGVRILLDGLVEVTSQAYQEGRMRSARMGA